MQTLGFTHAKSLKISMVWWSVQFHVASYRAGYIVMNSTGAFRELSEVLTGITLDRIAERRRQRQESYSGRPGRHRAGIQAGFNDELDTILTSHEHRWERQVPVFEPDSGSKKGYWTMDFKKTFAPLKYGVGVEVTFNHAEALPWTLIRPTLAYQEVEVKLGSRINVAAIIIGTDNLKGNRRDGSLRMDSAVGTYERLRTLLPKMKWVLPVQMVIFGLDWRDGGMTGDVEEIDLYVSQSGLSTSTPEDDSPGEEIEE